ncbi:uncharacterized protein A1O9_11777 [Exophiala aquamarina CBS 119918]|uniref:Xeroderma pigmentosum group C-complementing protein n=1 Tax=Exophiala aquamarina CBS 119918 TaxID=1182545 RepID=A0A072NX30_9EURO|nr:uncharacterized protein A1O9_11777 [Exophiala aquamarina CBS 119918]KEF52151.1 hypothetical protein A1O9_11777 [Exophiala aquamarina CBS 119918]
MPPRKTRLAKEPSRGTRRSTRRNEVVDHGFPDIYGDMVAEVVADESSERLATRSSKRRKISKESSGNIQLDIDLFGPTQHEDAKSQLQEQEAIVPVLRQIVYDDFGDSDDSDVEFEDVELEPAQDDVDMDENPEQKTLQLDLSTPALENSRSAVRRRKPVGSAERKKRLEVHKAHLICLLAHMSCRNRWCESESVHAVLKPLVPRKVISLLHDDGSKAQYQRSHSFTKGIEEICLLWRTTWNISERGMRRAHWKEEVDALKEIDDIEDLVEFEDFRSAAISHRGSRDLGAQLFCALLRSIAVDARLTCSLQVLPFSGVAKGLTPEKPKAQYYQAPSQNYNSSPFSRPERASGPPRKRIVDSPFPIFWVEVFSPATSTWIPVDPLVRNTINKPKTGFEPPASDQLNSMTYVLAFEDDGSAKDVTRRYTQWFNAKTRKQRVESTKGGAEWWKQTMDVFQKPFTEIRDEIEDADLLRRAATEPMPRNVQDFKGHPVYVLERHLRRNEVISPRHVVGKVSAGSNRNAKLEDVFRRRDVHVCRTADAWYRRGRDVNEGEQPLKRALPRQKRDAAARRINDFENEGEEADEGMALYAQFQTSLYEPPPVTDGQIPRNAYGNLDVYVPSMIPAGAAHIRHPLAAQAAKVLEINFVEAVTGFEFKGRQGTAVIDGVVVQINMCTAMVHVIEGLESQANEEIEAQRSRLLLGMWKRWLAALRIREKVHREYGTGEEDNHANDSADQEEDNESTYQGGEEAGGFMPEASEGPAHAVEKDYSLSFPSLKEIGLLLPPAVVHQDVIIVRSPNSLPHASESTARGDSSHTKQVEGAVEEAGGFFTDDGRETRLEEDTEMHADPETGGAMDNDADESESGGGFLPEDEETLEGVGVEPEPDSGTYAIEGPSKSPTAEVRAVDKVTAPPSSDGGVIADGASTTYPMEIVFPRDNSVHGGLSDSQTPQVTKREAGAQPDATVSPPSTASLQSETSLLSHDPDEEDAEPEWLLNSLGELG